MNKVLLNMKYKMRLHFNWLLTYLAIYISIIAVVFLALVQTSIISTEEGSLFYRLWGVVFFQLGISLKFKDDFDFFLILSNSRMTIFQSMVGVGVVFSGLLSIIVILEQVVVDFLNDYFGFNNIIDPFHFTAPYLTDNLFLQFIFFMSTCICFALVGLLLGSLSYRFGKPFILGGWLVVSAIFALFLPWLMWNSYQEGELSLLIESVTQFFINFDLLVSSGYLLIFSLVFAFAAYLNIRRLPQK